MRCDECDREPPPFFEPAWIAVLVDVPDDLPVDVILFCPDCAERESEAAHTPAWDSRH